MNRTVGDHGRKAVSAFLRLFESASADECVSRLVAQVRAAQEKMHASIPVRLSDVAEEFDISPMPEFDRDIGDGEIAYRPSVQRFVITLNSRFRPSNRKSAAMWANKDEVDECELLARGRFTYAHEFCHRFFFLPGSAGWERAQVRMVDETIGEKARWEVLQAVRPLEERLCNNASGELLVPTEALQMLVGESLVPSPGARACNLYELARTIQAKFLVSFECALVRLERLVRQSVIPCAGDYAAMLIERSDQKGAADRTSTGRSRSAMRVKCAILPRTLGEQNVRPIFPGIAVANFGTELAEFVKSVCDESEGPSHPRKLETRVRFELSNKRINQREIEAKFVGQCVPINRRQAPSMGPSMLLWGTVGSY